MLGAQAKRATMSVALFVPPVARFSILVAGAGFTRGRLYLKRQELLDLDPGAEVFLSET
jgi:hypothetical protein